MDSIKRKKNTGEPGNGGQFGSKGHSEADVSLRSPASPDAIELDSTADTAPPLTLEPGESVTVIANIDGVNETVTVTALTTGTYAWQVDGAESESIGSDATTSTIRRRLTHAVVTEQLRKVEQARTSPWAQSQDPAVFDRERDRLLDVDADPLTIPEDWEGEELTAASERIGEWLIGPGISDRPGEVDLVNARCDYAEVGEDGIAYGIELDHSVWTNTIAPHLAYAQEDLERQTELFEQLDIDEVNAIENAISDKYGCDVRFDGDYGDLVAEFHVPYEDVLGSERTSLQQMGDRVESETKIMALFNDYSVGRGVDRVVEDALKRTGRSCEVAS